MVGEHLWQLGKLLIALGLGIAILGGLVMLMARVSGVPRLPGDILIERPGLTVYLPLGTSLLLSLLLTLALLAVRYLRR